MTILLNKHNQIRFLFLGTLLLLLLGGIVFPFQGQVGITLFILSISVSMIGIIAGTVAALGVSLVLFFVIGSVLFWVPFTPFAIFPKQIPLMYLLVWMAVLLMLALFTGQLSLLLKELAQDNNRLQEQIRELVAVDPVTGFDNQERMLLELKMEYNRSKRHGHTFTLLLIKINYLESFEKLYGDPELSRLFHHFSEVIYQTVRLSDLKFRPELDIIGILLNDTEVANIQVVINKLQPLLETHQLANGKYVTMTLDFGFIGLSDVADHGEIYSLAKEQVSEYVS